MSAYGRVGVLMCQHIVVSVFDMSAYCRVGVLMCQRIVGSVF